MKEEYSNLEFFLQDLKKESVKQIILDMGYLKEDDFIGSKTCCIFHKEIEPSLQITNNFFKCYGCGAKGDVISFIQTIENLTFIEAIQKLSHHFSTNIKDSSISKYSKIQKRLTKEWEYYVQCFNEKIKEDTEYAKHIMNMGKKYFPHTVGYDEKNGYIVLPFTSKTGGILGFTKRIDKNERIKQPFFPRWKHSDLKYSLISSCHNIFNLGMAYKKIKETCSVYIAEGPGDVAAMQRAKFLNTIAICGSENFSSKILELLYPLKRICLAMDGDETGRKATRNIISTILFLEPLLIEETYVIPMYDDEDPGCLTSDEIRERESSKVKALNWFISNADSIETKNLYKNCKSEIIKPKIISSVAKSKNFTIEQAREWLGMQSSYPRKELEEEFRQRLLATIGMCDDINVPILEEMSEYQAKRILRLRFKENY